MMNNHDNANIEATLLSFREWLLLNRTGLNDSLRKYNAVKYYVVTMGIGIGVFTTNSVFQNSEWLILKLVILTLLVLLVLLSGKISEALSGIKKYHKLDCAQSEIKGHWLQKLPGLTGKNSSLLQDVHVAKAVKLSKRGKFNLPVFYRALVFIADAVVDEEKEREAAEV